MWRRAAATGLISAVVAAVGLLGLGVGPASAATELTVSPASGPPGTEIVVTGTGFAALPVEIRWGGLSGPVLATAAGPAFSVTATVPDSLPNSVPVMAVVTNGNSVSTSSASFQVTGGDVPPAPAAPAEITTSTTVARTPATTPTASIPGGESGSPVRGGPARDSPARDSGLGGGIDGGADNAATATSSGGGAPAATSPATVTTVATVAAAEVTTPTVTLASPVPPAAAAGQGPAAVPLAPGDGVAAAALAPSPTSQSAGAVSNPPLLFLGLGLVFAGGVFLAVRNRQRA